MISFEYRGYDQSGAARKGLIEALDVKDARERLVQQGILPEKVTKPGVSVATGAVRRSSGLPAEFRSVFYRECSAFLAAGFTLVQSLDQLINSPETEKYHSSLARVRDDVRDGADFSSAFSGASHADPFEISVLEVGERTGTLQEVMSQLADYLDKESVVRDRMRSALIYPAIIFGLSLLVGMIMLSWLLPRYHDMMLEADIRMPFLTKMMMTAGDIISMVILPLVCLLAAIGGLQRYKAEKNRELAIRLDRRKYSLPVLGQIYRLLINLRFARTLAILIQGGISVVDGIVHAARATGSPWLIALAEKEQPSVVQGGGVAEAVSRMPPLADLLTGWLRAGEASGELAPLLEGAAGRLEHKWNRSITRALSLLEPLLILIVGIFVLLVMLAVLLPINAMREGIGGF